MNWKQWKKKLRIFLKKYIAIDDIESSTAHWNPDTSATPEEILQYLKQYAITAQSRNQHDHFRNTPILQSIAERNKPLALYLLQQDFAALDMSDLDRESYNSPLLLAVKVGMKEVALAIIAKKVDVDLADAQGFTPLHWAAIYRDEQLILDLIEAGADVNLTNKYEVAPLEYYRYHITPSDLHYNYRCDTEGCVMLDGQNIPIFIPTPILPDFKHLFYYVEDLERFFVNRPHFNPKIRKLFLKKGAKEQDGFYLRVIKNYQDRAASLVKGINSYRRKLVKPLAAQDALKLEFFLIDATQDLSEKITDLAVSYTYTKMNLKKTWQKSALGKKSKKA